MAEIEHSGTSKAMPAIKTCEEGEFVAGEITHDPTTRTLAPPSVDKIANDRGILPIPRPAAE